MYSRLAALGLAFLLAGAAPAEGPRHLFIQVTFEGGLPRTISADDYPGRVELTNDGAFLGCAWAPWYRVNSEDVALVPLAVGWTAVGYRDRIKVEVLGSLNGASRPVVKITDVGAFP